MPLSERDGSERGIPADMNDILDMVPVKGRGFDLFETFVAEEVGEWRSYSMQNLSQFLEYLGIESI